MLVGLLGSGTLGRRLGVRLMGAGHHLRIHDRVRAHAELLLGAGAVWAESPESLAEGCDALVTALPRAADVEGILLGTRRPWVDAAPGTLHIETSTVGIECILRLGEAARRNKIRFLDCPVSRGRTVGSEPEIVTWVGGNADHYGLALPILQALADRVVYCGKVGHGQIVKLANNSIAHCLTVIIGEVLALSVRAGVSLDILHSALRTGTAQNLLLDEMLPASVFRGDWRPGLRLDLAIKDLRLAVELAQRHDVELPTVDRLRSVYDMASSRGWGDLSAHAVVRLAEEAAGVELRSEVFKSLQPPPAAD